MEKSKEFFYTKEEMVKDLLSITPIKEDDVVLDAGSGKNKVWFNCLKNNIKYECEIEDGCNFYDFNKEVDWVVGNPPFRFGGKNQMWLWIEKSSKIAKNGMAFLLNHRFLNLLTPNRLEKLRDCGFYLNQLHIFNDKRWYGRYYYVIFTKERSNFIGWENKTY
jgi:hypothetical protein